MIIDAHYHLGPCNVFGLNFTEEEIINSMDKHEIDVAIVQPFPGAPDPVEVHNRIADLANKYPGRIFGLASLNPHMPKSNYTDEVARCITELGFVGIKLHTIGHSVIPLGEDANIVFEMAFKYNVPVMVHTGPGIPFSLPSLCIPKARQYPNVSVVLAHAGGGLLTAEAYVAAKECSNIYLETSWCSIDDIGWLINDIGADKVMMGSDTLLNVPVELAKYRSLELSEENLAKCLGNTAAKVFNLKI